MERLTFLVWISSNQHVVYNFRCAVVLCAAKVGVELAQVSYHNDDTRVVQHKRWWEPCKGKDKTYAETNTQFFMRYSSTAIVHALTLAK